jgi:predicted N-acetyltransferase YhbS
MKKKFKKITCRMIRKEDVRAVEKLHDEAFASEDDLGNRVRGKTLRALVATKNDGTIVGYVLFDIEQNEREKVIYVANVGVGVKYRSRGVCGVMLPWLVARLTRLGIKRAYLTVFSDKEGAVSCYTSAGFKKDTKRSSAYMVYRVPRRRVATKRKSAPKRKAA